MLSSRQTQEKIPCLLCGMLPQAHQEKPSSTHTQTELLPLISMKMETWSSLWVKQILPPNNKSASGDGKKKNHSTSLQKWMKRSNVCKNSSNSIIMKTNSLPQGNPSSFSGSGKTAREPSNCIHPRSQLRRPSLRLYFYPIPHKQSQEQRKESSLCGIFPLSWKITHNQKKEGA